MQPLGEGPGPLHAARVRGDHHHVGAEALPDIIQDHRRREEMVHGDIKEPLDLAGVQVHGQEAVGPRGGD